MANRVGLGALTLLQWPHAYARAVRHCHDSSPLPLRAGRLSARICPPVTPPEDGVPQSSRHSSERRSREWHCLWERQGRNGLNPHSAWTPRAVLVRLHHSHTFQSFRHSLRACQVHRRASMKLIPGANESFVGQDLRWESSGRGEISLAVSSFLTAKM